MSKYKGEGYSTTFNYGIKSVLRRKQSKDKLLEVVSLGKEIKAILLFEGDSLVASRAFVLPRDIRAKKMMEKTIISEYNLYKMYLMKGSLVSFDAIDLF